MPVPGKLEVTIKINQLPDDVITDKHGWKRFRIDCGGRPVDVHIRPRMWNKLEEAAKTYPLWVASITGTMGQSVGQGFILAEPSVQVFERKARPEEPSPPAPPAPPTSTES